MSEYKRKIFTVDIKEAYDPDGNKYKDLVEQLQAELKQRKKAHLDLCIEYEELKENLAKVQPVLDAAKKLSSNQDNWCTSWFDLDRLDDAVKAMEE